jgi:hypothetical protein
VEVLREPVGGRRIRKLVRVSELLHVAHEHAATGLPRIRGARTLAIGASKGS